jgi:hypothetical protein
MSLNITADSYATVLEPFVVVLRPSVGQSFSQYEGGYESPGAAVGHSQRIPSNKDVEVWTNLLTLHTHSRTRSDAGAQWHAEQAHPTASALAAEYRLVAIPLVPGELG